MIYSYTGDGIQLGQTKREKEELLTTAKLLVEVGLQGCQKKTPVKYKLRVKVVDRPDIILDLLFLLLLSVLQTCLLYTSPSPRDRTRSRMPSSA